MGCGGFIWYFSIRIIMDNLTFKIKERYKKVGSFFIIKPHYHWTVLLRVFSFVTIVLIIFSLYLFFRIKNEQVYEITSVSPNKKSELKEKLLKEVIESFDKKTEKTRILKEGTSASGLEI